MEKFLENLQEAERIIQTADHIMYVTFPLIKDKKLLLKILLETKKAVTNCINSILHYEYLYKRIKLYKDSKKNLRIFKEKSSIRYSITKEEIGSMEELFELVEKYKKSSMEFVKNEKIVILSENMKQETISLEKIKNFLSLSKKILEKTKNGILG